MCPRASSRNTIRSVHVETDREEPQHLTTLHLVQVRETLSSFCIGSLQGRTRFQQEKMAPANRGRRGSRKVDDSCSEA